MIIHYPGTCTVRSNYFDRRWLLGRGDLFRDTGCV